MEKRQQNRLKIKKGKKDRQKDRKKKEQESAEAISGLKKIIVIDVW